MLAFIGCSIEYKRQAATMQLYRTLVRMHLEYWMKFWSPHYWKDGKALERV